MKTSFLDYTQNKNWLNDAHKQALLQLIAASFNDVDAEYYFNKYFVANDVFARKLRLYFAQNEVVGYCLINFSQSGKNVLIRASAAFYPQYRKGGNTFMYSMKQAFICWLKSPRQNIYYADTMLSPAMYRAMAKKLAIIWPNANGKEQAKQLFEQFNKDGFDSPVLKVPCLVTAGRASNYSAQEVANFKTSDKEEINFYCQLNPEFAKGTALFVIIPVTLKQFFLTGIKLLTPFYR